MLAVPASSEHRPVIDAIPNAGATSPALIFDLSLSLKAQLDAAKKYLIARQRHLAQRDPRQTFRNTVHRDRWTLCLRALDAGIDSATPDDPAAQLLPHATNAVATLSGL